MNRFYILIGSFDHDVTRDTKQNVAIRTRKPEIYHATRANREIRAQIFYSGKCMAVVNLLLLRADQNEKSRRKKEFGLCAPLFSV